MRRFWSIGSVVLRYPPLQAPLRVAAVATWLGLAILSLASDQASARGGASGDLALPLAFGVAALVTRLAFRFTKSRWQTAAFAAAAAAALHQLWLLAAPDGQGSVRRWLLETLGAFIGIVIGRAIDHLTWRARSGS